MKMKKQYISPSIQVLEIGVDNILCASQNSCPGMDPFPSEPGFFNSEEEYEGGQGQKTDLWDF